MISSDIRIPRWMRLALPDDTAQLVRIADWLIPESQTRDKWLKLELRKLRYEVWDRTPTKKPRALAALRPSKLKRITGWRKHHDKTRLLH